MTTQTTTPSPVRGSAALRAVRKANGKGLAAVLLAAFVSALIVAADSVVDTYADGHLLIGWMSLWIVSFAAMVLLAGPAREAAARLACFIGTWGQRRAQKRADVYLMALALHDPRIMAEVQAAIQRAEADALTMERALGEAWVDRHPLGTFNAAYQGRRDSFRTTPLAGLPVNLQCLPG